MIPATIGSRFRSSDRLGRPALGRRAGDLDEAALDPDLQRSVRRICSR